MRGTGSVWQLEVGDRICGGVSYLGLMEMHICRRGPRLMPARTELGVTTRAILGGLHPTPLQDLGSHGMWGLVPVPTYP